MPAKRTLPVVSNCDNCGACCTGQAALPVALVGDGFRMEPVSPLPPELVTELLAIRTRFIADGFPPDGSPCIWYDAETRRCRHYEHRPTLCRDAVKVGDEACRRSLGIDKQGRYVVRGGAITRVPA